MHDFIIEIFRGWVNTSKNASFLGKKGRELLKSLKNVNKCKSNTKAGKELTKVAGFDVYSDLAENVKKLVMKNKLYRKFSLDIESGFIYGGVIS